MFIITGIFPPDIGGPASYVPKIAAALTARGHRVRVLSLSDRLTHDDSHYSFPVVRISRRLAKFVRWPRTLLSILHYGRDADLLFVNGLALEATLANFFLRKPLVLKVVGDHAWEQATNRLWTNLSFDDFQKETGGIAISILKWLRSWWTRRADVVIVPSAYLRGIVEKWGASPPMINIIRNAVEVPTELRSRSRKADPVLQIITVCRLVSWKGVAELIQVVRELSGVSCTIVGDGPERSVLEQNAQGLIGEGRIRFTGSLAHQECLLLIAASDIFVLNSRYEGLPHVAVEAVLLGVPVIARAVGGTPEIVMHEGNGLLVQVDAPNGLRLALERVLQNRPLRERLAAGCRKVSREFETPVMLDATEKILLSAVGVAPRAHCL